MNENYKEKIRLGFGQKCIESFLNLFELTGVFSSKVNV